MNTISGTGGLFARQWTYQKIKRIILSVRSCIKRSLFLALIAGAFIVVSSCDKKTNGQNAAEVKSGHAAVAKDTLNKPKVNIQVNRRYDDKGNLVGFDSTYSSFYSSIKGDTVEMDSLMHRFDRYFSSNHSSFLDDRFNTLFFDDSVRYPDFFHKDYFMKRYELNDDYLRGTMHRMDSIKNHFFYEQSRKKKHTKTL